MNKPIVRVPSNLAGPAYTADGLVNFASRVGTGADKATHGRYVTNWADLWDLEAAFRSTWFGKICKIIPFDEVRKWRTWNGADPNQVTAIDNEEKRLELRQKVAEARVLARKDGGAAIVIGVGDADPSTELTADMIGQGGLRYLSVCNRYEISPAERQRNPALPYFNEPRSYRLSNVSGTTIHPSRVVRFIGNPIYQAGHWDGWGESIWIEIADKVRKADQIGSSIAASVDEAKLDIIKLKNLMANLTTQAGEDALTKRMQIANTLKSSVNALILDFDDAYERKELAFSGLTEIQMAALTIMAGISDIPVTRLIGKSADGMNATGEGDMRNYHDRISAGQELELGPKLNRIDEVLIRSAIGDRPDDINYVWNPLYQMSEKEAAEVEKMFADAANTLATSALVPDDALTAMVKAGMIERGQWPDAESAFADATKEAGILEEPSDAEMAEEEARMAVALQTAANPAGEARQKPRLVASRDARFNDATPRTLYVRRDVLNRADFERWAKAQGITDMVPDLHVTIAYSKTAVDWFKIGQSWSDKYEIAAGGPRQMEGMGQNGEYHALLIAASELNWRNREIIEAGASWDWPDYQPHITIKVGVDMPENVNPYQGKIILGPEIFEELRD